MLSTLAVLAGLAAAAVLLARGAVQRVMDELLAATTPSRSAVETHATPSTPLPPAPASVPLPAPAAAPLPAASPPTRPVTRPGIRLPSASHALDASIVALSDTRYRIRRAFVESVLSDESLQRTVRVVPQSLQGRPIGVKLFGIRSGSLLDRIGLLDGDVLRELNGYSLATPDSALEAYARLRHASDLSLVLDRDGRPLTLRYRIED